MGTCLLSSSVASILLAVAASPVIAQDSASSSRVRIGFEIAPVPLDLRGKNRALVGLGSYLVNATGTHPWATPSSQKQSGAPPQAHCRNWPADPTSRVSLAVRLQLNSLIASDAV